MWTDLAYALAAAAASVFHAGALTFGNSPLGLVNLWLIIAVGLVADFRLRRALIVAVVGGLTADSLSSLSPGITAIAGVSAVLLAGILIVRVFTQQSVAAIVGLQAVAFVVFWLVLLASHAGRLVLMGWTAESAVWPGFTSFLTAVAVQCVVAVLFHSVGRWFVRRFSAIVLVVARRPRPLRP